MWLGPLSTPEVDVVWAAWQQVQGARVAAAGAQVGG